MISKFSWKRNQRQASRWRLQVE